MAAGGRGMTAVTAALGFFFFSSVFFPSLIFPAFIPRGERERERYRWIYLVGGGGVLYDVTAGLKYHIPAHHHHCIKSSAQLLPPLPLIIF